MTNEFDSADYVLYPYFSATKYKANPKTGAKAFAVVRWEIKKNSNICDLIEKYLWSPNWHCEDKSRKRIARVQSSKDISKPLSKLISETTPYEYVLPEKLEAVLKRIYNFNNVPEDLTQKKIIWIVDLLFNSQL
ncbi:hypothetical protein JW756_06105 [Candidatus Woesearchaeota archaeon]|nr:hypothetical protein [Candidatus Woesearchaeota archaeon]